MDLSEVKNYELDFSKLGQAPVLIKVLLAIIVLGIVLGLGYYLHTRQQIETLKSVEAKESDLRSTYENKYHQSANLEEYKAQLAEMEEEFGDMLRQLPSETEIPAVVLDVSQTGLASGLEIQLFRPLPEIEQGFYAEKPIKIQVRGKYHEMANFTSGIAALPRIVTLNDLKLVPEKDGDKIIMNVTAKTYRYLADKEIEQKTINKHKKKQQKGKSNG